MASPVMLVDNIIVKIFKGDPPHTRRSATPSCVQVKTVLLDGARNYKA